MNKHGRKQLAEAIELIEKAKEIIDYIADEEMGKFDKMPEGLQQSKQGENLYENSDELEAVNGDLDDIIGQIQDVIDK